MVATHNAPFSMLWQFAGNATQCEIYSAQNTIDSLLRVEAALAQAQGEQGVISVQDATAIKGACVAENIDHDELWASARNVGYPIFGLVRQISEHLPEGPDGRVHYGATTQDIMDSGLALQMSASLEALDAQLQRLGDALATQADRYKDAVMAGRTHAQQ
ncbi:3-carboxy-cis,cis-muconate cycloisomerase, partial [Propionibacterium freudenreichii]|nr:3-carboxy-cis,cis-muconate cycloisomerase [Propionibacterium freudenreichii]